MAFKQMWLFFSLIISSSYAFADLSVILSKFGKKPIYGLSEFRTNSVLRINQNSEALPFSNKQVGSHLIVVGMPKPGVQLKEPIIIAGGLMSSQQGYSDIAESYKALGHPVIMISPPGHGAHDTADVTPMYKGDMHFVDSYALKIESTIDFVQKMFPNQKPILTGHSLGGIGSALYTYGAMYDRAKNLMIQSSEIARERWAKLKGIIYKNGPLMIDMDVQDKAMTEKAMKSLGPVMHNSDMLNKTGVLRSFFDAPMLGYIPRFWTGYFSELSFWSTRKKTEEAFKGMINHRETSPGEIARVVHSSASTTNLPEGIKFSIFISSISHKWTATQPVYMALVEKGYIRAENMDDLKELNKFLISSLEGNQQTFKLYSRPVVSFNDIFQTIADALDQTVELGDIVKNPAKHIGPIIEKPKEIALVADDDPLGNSDVMRKLFADGRKKRRVYRNNKGHMGIMLFGHTIKEQPFILQGFSQNFRNQDFVDLDNHFPPDQIRKSGSCLRTIWLMLSL